MSDRRKLIWERGALEDLLRLREFIRPHNPKAAANAAQCIIKSANLLLEHPQLGRPIKDIPQFNEIFIPFGQRGYILRYRIADQKIVILRVWHSRENRY